MRDINILLKEIRSYLERRSTKVDKNYLERQAHFDQLEANLATMDLTKTQTHIAQGLAKFNSKNPLRSKRYHQFLRELESQFSSLLIGDATVTRSEWLKKAIATNSLPKVITALKTYAKPIINQDQSVIPTAILIGNPHILIQLLKAHAPMPLSFDKSAIVNILLKISPFNNVFLVDGNTLLHFAAQYNLAELAEHILKSQILLNQKNNLGNTALHIAVQYRNIEVLVKLLACPHIKKDISNQQGQSVLEVACIRPEPFILLKLFEFGFKPQTLYQKQTVELYYAIYQGSVETVKKWINAGKKVDDIALQITAAAYLKANGPLASKAESSIKTSDATLANTAEKVYTIIRKSPYRSAKHSLMAKGPLKPLSGKQSVTPIEAISSTLYVQNPSNVPSIETDLQSIYQHSNGILRPILEVAAFAALGNTIPNNKKEKKLKFFIADTDSVEDFNKGLDSADAGGYLLKNSIFVAGKNPQDFTLQTLLHEITHAVALIVMGNDAKPYRDNYMSDHFDKATRMIPINLDQLNKTTKNPLEKKAANIFLGVSDYEAEDHHGEYIARTVEVYGLFCAELGVKKGMTEADQWLTTHAPALHAYLKLKFNTGCKKYINSHNTLDTTNRYRLFTQRSECDGPGKQQIEKDQRHTRSIQQPTT